MKTLQILLASTALAANAVSAAEPEAREWTAKDGRVVKYRWSAPEKPEPGKTSRPSLTISGRKLEIIGRSFAGCWSSSGIDVLAQDTRVWKISGIFHRGHACFIPSSRSA